jgi:hypothetical protein
MFLDPLSKVIHKYIVIENERFEEFHIRTSYFGGG